ncbi:MAG: hypothetical protein H0U65_11495 [Rubrobacter sp.]|nr:hypothetical protein [Rubrobacter sp.]
MGIFRQFMVFPGRSRHVEGRCRCPGWRGVRLGWFRRRFACGVFGEVMVFVGRIKIERRVEEEFWRGRE